MAAIGDKLDEKDTLAAAHSLAAVMGRTPAYFRDSFVRAWKSLADKLPNQEIVDVLKNPMCVGTIRDALLHTLSQRLNRRFDDLWDLCAWAQEHPAELDLSSPPVRLDR